MNFSELNYPAILVAGIAKFVLGGLWYSPALFTKPWLAELKLTEEQIARSKAQGMGGKLVMTFLMGLLEVFVLAIALKAMGCRSASCGAGTGLMLGVGFTAMPLATNFLFEQRSLRLFLITAGFPVVAAVLAGAILGAWPK